MFPQLYMYVLLTIGSQYWCKNKFFVSRLIFIKNEKKIMEKALTLQLNLIGLLQHLLP